MICVTASDSNDNLWTYSNFGATSVKLAAPGVNIYSTVRFGKYGFISGGSMASPMVAGTAALILSLGDQTVANLRSMILNNVDVIPSLNGQVATGGRLNICKAVPGCVSAVTAVPVNTALPSVIGMPQYGSFLSASTGKWSGVPISFSYQWFRCNNSGASCSIIAGATAQSYALLAPADTGATFRVTVVASNAKGSASAQSGASGVVAAASSPFAVGSSLSNGSTVGGTIQWDATPGVTVNFAQFYIDGVLVQTVSSSPYRFNQSGNGLLDTTQLTNGSHIFGIRALSTDNRTYGFSSVTMTVSNGTTNSAPTVVSVTPSSGSASNQTFAFVYADPNGFADLSFAQVNIATTLSAANACYVHYDRASNSAYLVNDAGTTGIGPVVLGSAGSAQNSQCVLNGTGSSAVGSGNNLTVTLALTFKPAFAGSKVVNLYAQDVGGLGSGFQQMGTWSAQ
jgi:hypothetical protein